jgi:hypothetical protein
MDSNTRHFFQQNDKLRKSVRHFVTDGHTVSKHISLEFKEKAQKIA